MSQAVRPQAVARYLKQTYQCSCEESEVIIRQLTKDDLERLSKLDRDTIAKIRELVMERMRDGSLEPFESAAALDPTPDIALPDLALSSTPMMIPSFVFRGGPAATHTPRAREQMRQFRQVHRLDQKLAAQLAYTGCKDVPSKNPLSISMPPSLKGTFFTRAIDQVRLAKRRREIRARQQKPAQSVERESAGCFPVRRMACKR
jgi:hypothetical protein